MGAENSVVTESIVYEPLKSPIVLSNSHLDEDIDNIGDPAYSIYYDSVFLEGYQKTNWLQWILSQTMFCFPKKSNEHID